VDDRELSEAPQRVSRRDLLRRASRLGGALVWTIPLIQSVDIRAAAALAGSSPPDDPPADPPPVDSGGTDPVVGQNPAGGGGGSGSGQVLALEIVQLTASPAPLRLGDRGQLRIRFFVTGAATVEIQIVRGGKVVKSYPLRELNAADWVDVRWNGKNRRGTLAHRGRYTVVVRARHGLDAAEASLQVRVVP
jgi:hypothetical protein